MGQLMTWLKGLWEIRNSADGPDEVVRALITFTVVATYVWLQWTSPDPKAYVVPGALVSAAGLVTGFYLTSDASVSMKSILSVTYVFAFALFMWRYGWVPESVNTQVTTVLGIYFGKKVQDATKAVPKVDSLTAEQRAGLQAALQKPVVAKPNA